MHDNAITTATFRISPASYAAIIMRRWLAIWWWAVAALPLCSIAAAILMADIRYLMLALVLVCLVIPPALLIVYYYYALDPKARVNIPPHTVGCDGHTLSISEYAAPQPDSNEENDNVDTTPQAESTSPDDAPVAVSKIPLSSLYGMRHSRGNICINLDNRIIPPMLIIPYTAFPSSASLREFLAMIKN